MDTPESPTRSLQSPVEEKDLFDSEILDSPDDEEDRAISESELLYEENGELAEEDEEEDTVEIAGGGLALQAVGGEEDEVVPDFVSEPEDEEPVEETGGMGQETEAILLMEGDDYDDDDDKDEDDEDDGNLQQAGNLDREDEVGDVDDHVLDTPQSPESEPEQGKNFLSKESKEDLSEANGDYKRGSADLGADVDDEEEDEEKGVKSIEEEENDILRAGVGRAAVSRKVKEDSPSVSRELDEHELDYDEEVPEEPNIPTHEDEEEEYAKALEEEVNQETTVKKIEKKPILPPSPKDGESRKKDDSKLRRDSFRDKRKEDDDGEIDEGEIDDDDLEEGEVKDPSDRKIRPRPICRFFIKGNCTWGMNCRFIHPGVNDKGNYSLITKPDLFSPNGAQPGGPLPLIPNNSWATPAIEELPPPPPPVESPSESAWERGLRHAKEMLKKATIRKEQEPDFEEKRFNVTIGEDEREFDKENEFFRDRYRIIRDEMDTREPIYGDQYADPYYEYGMEALWRGGQYENFRVQHIEAPLPYHYNERERERDPRERHRDRERERDHRERERRQREREREREREKERMRRKEEWERDRIKRDEKERPKMRPPRDMREKKDDKLTPQSPLILPPNRPMEPPTKKDLVPLMRQPDEWKDPWRRSKSPRRRSGLGSPPRGRRRNRRSGSSVSLSNSSRSSSRSSSYTGSGSSRSRSRSSSFSSYSSHSSRHSSFSGSRSRSRSFSTSPSPAPAVQRNAKNKPDLPPVLAKGVPLKQGAAPIPRRDKPPMKKAQTPPPPPPPSGPMNRPFKPLPEGGKPPTNLREPGGVVIGAGGDASAGGGGVMVRQIPSREPAKPSSQREGRQKERQQHPPRRRTVSGSVSGSGSSYTGSSSRSRSSSNSLSHSRSGSRKSKKSRSLSVSSVSSVSSGSSGSSSVRSADSDDMYADLASPVSSASTRSPTPGHPRKERAAPTRERPPQSREKNRERPVKKDEPVREDRRKINPSSGPPRGGNPMPRPVPGSRGGNPAHHPAGNMPPPGNYGGPSSHKDIKLTLLNKQQGDKGSRKRYLPSEKDRPGSPLSKRMAMSPDRARDRRISGRPPLSPRMDRPRGQGPRPVASQGDRKRPLSPPPKSSGKGSGVQSGKVAPSAPAPPPASGKPSNTLSRREELLKQLKAVEDAIARKRAKIPGK
ncbi:zinc finger CCCH domain-containing protein 18 [Corythoichthys intestinalis]|uniref:zinc finger CCCH domain-containing protein 18 n=1 Tax=Corythoichthys intestinalis TaxID=161448 RepID=UPI0025A5886A|nr:zinc finger CCCH domain-containing protein 18 [Corythoichthys intestinalis]XP_061813260.1 zinc finger CCCH domain-containing protein 18-like [Nerophis lumbriciformis]